jgi:hypothetical protein
MKLIEILRLFSFLRGIQDNNGSLVGSLLYRLSTIINHLKPHVDEYNEGIKKLNEQFLSTKEDGSLILNEHGNPVFKLNADPNAYNAALTDLYETEIQTNMPAYIEPHELNDLRVPSAGMGDDVSLIFTMLSKPKE